MTPWIVMRSHNDVDVIRETLDGLRRQTRPYRLLVLDNASSDGTAEILRLVADRFIHVPAGAYVPGRVLNQGMRESDGEVVVFLNSDCTPRRPDWLARLVAPFEDPEVGAVFGRQDPRPDCRPLFAKDTEDTYGGGEKQARWRHCFSMASSAVRRSVWESIPFDEALGYSEDIDWSWRIRGGGHRIAYVAESRVFHSHNYSLSQFFRRHRGEGRAEAAIFDWSPWQRSLFRYSVLPWLRQVLSDWRFAIRRREPAALVHAPFLRTAQMLGRRIGFNEGRLAQEMS